MELEARGWFYEQVAGCAVPCDATAVAELSVAGRYLPATELEDRGAFYCSAGIRSPALVVVAGVRRTRCCDARSSLPRRRDGFFGG
jgi:hypothetical protein